MQARAEHVRFPGDVARVIDEVKIARQLGEYMYQICTGKFGSEEANPRRGFCRLEMMTWMMKKKGRHTYHPA